MRTAEEVAREVCENGQSHYAGGGCHESITRAIERDRREQAQAVLPLVRRTLWGGLTYTPAERKAAEAWLKSVEETYHD